MFGKLFNKVNYSRNRRNGFVFAVTSLTVSLVVGVIVVYLFNTVTLETTTASKAISSRIAFWKALSRVRMLEQLIKDYGFNNVAAGGIVGNVTFIQIDECHRKVISEITVGDYKRRVKGILENLACGGEGFPNYSMIHRAEEGYHPGRGYCRGWRHWGVGRGLAWWGWRLGLGSCADIWGWHWNPPCGGNNNHGGHNNNHDNHSNHGGGNDYDWFQIKGWSGKLDGELYVGANLLIEYTPWGTKPHVGWYDNTTNFKVPVSCSVVPGTAVGGNHYTWENVTVEDLPDFDHLDYDSLLNIAENMSHSPGNGQYVGNVNWPYNGQWGNTQMFYLHNYPNRTLFVRGDVTIKWCRIKNDGGSKNAPGIIVATGDIKVQSPTGGKIPDNIILISGEDVKLYWTNMGTALPQVQWKNVVNEIYARGKIYIKGGNRQLGQFFAFGDTGSSYSFKTKWTSVWGLLYAPDPDKYIELSKWEWFKGAMYVSSVKNDRFKDTYVLLHRDFPTHYFTGGLTGIDGPGAGGENWVLVDGSLIEI